LNEQTGMRVAISIVLRLEKPTSNEQEQKGVIQLKYIATSGSQPFDFIILYIFQASSLINFRSVYSSVSSFLVHILIFCKF